MKQRITLIAVVLASLASMMFAGAARAERRPNVLLILTDDQGFGDIASHGNKYIDTPTLDNFAAGGARFDRFFVSPVCAPTRAALLTGRWSLRTGVHGVTRNAETMRADELTIAELLKQAGYVTGCFGKWHNGGHYPQNPNGQGFDDFVGFCAGHWNDDFDYVLQHNGKPIHFDGYIADYLTKQAMGFIRTHRDQPWFCYVPYNTPHTPWQVPQKYWDKYIKRLPKDREAACAYAMVECIDDNVRQLLGELDDLHLRDNTIVIFLSDNGANSDRYNAGMRGRKCSVHEGGGRVPMFVQYPGHVKAGTVIHAIAAHIDVLPTLAQWCGADLSSAGGKPIDGVSLVPMLEGRQTMWPNDRHLFTHYVKNGGVRTQHWRATRGGDHPWQLFDMIHDPGETHNVAKEYPDVVAELSKSYDQWYADATSAGLDPIPTDIGHPEAPSVTLLAPEAYLSGGGISYHEPQGWANDWITNWTSTNAKARWAVSVVHAGRYHVSLRYACDPADVGATVRITLNGAALEGVINKPFENHALPVHDRIHRKEVMPMTWGELDLGEIDLPTGKGDLMIQALKIPGKHVMDLKGVTLTRVK